uniref:Uncharacterized protein n=1 Tax=Arundo donax TaxID=35708 RepID=A0A0A8ZYJ5_ARUDO
MKLSYVQFSYCTTKTVFLLLTRSGTCMIFLNTNLWQVLGLFMAVGAQEVRIGLILAIVLSMFVAAAAVAQCDFQGRFIFSAAGSSAYSSGSR